MTEVGEFDSHTLYSIQPYVLNLVYHLGRFDGFLQYN
jgi:hypothetical protein